MANKNEQLLKAKKAKNDEFYTRLVDIEKELSHYKDQLQGKWVYSPCDDYRWSNFTKYFTENFEVLGLSHYTCTNYNIGNGAFRFDYDGENTTITELEGNGSFNSEECTKIMKECDIVITNPPFSLFRAFIKQLMDYNKKFIIIGNLNAITYKEIFPYIKNNEIWLGATYFNGGAAYFVGDKDLFDPEKISNAKHAYIKDGKLYWRVNGVRWFTNVPHDKRNTHIELYKKYNPAEYPKYDNYDAIEVSRVENIPIDYQGIMGVPISFLHKYCPNQFEIVGLMRPKVDGKAKYARILIRRKQL